MYKPIPRFHQFSGHLLRTFQTVRSAQFGDVPLEKRHITVKVFDHSRTVTECRIQFRLGFQIPFQALAVFALQFNQHLRHGQHFAGGIRKGQTQFFCPFNCPRHKAFVSAAGFRSQRAVKLPQYGQLFIQSDAVVGTDAPRPFHQVFDSAHFGTEDLAHIHHFSGQLLSELNLAQTLRIGGKITKHLPHKFRRFCGGGFQGKRQGISNFCHFRQFITGQPGNGGINTFSGLNKFHRTGAISCTEAQRIPLYGF
ncbi:Uncharacterised protein [Salmonella enterica subsp. enterica serovar Typhimurium str. DT104]|nr:Uncharacterised protein [Salmonella enterica subsp. enterica serovar Typhimurium str. DT104]